MASGLRTASYFLRIGPIVLRIALFFCRKALIFHEKKIELTATLLLDGP